MQPTKEEMELTPQVVKVLEKLEVECPKCKGKGSYWKDGKVLSDKRAEVLPKIKCKKCNGTGKVKWQWEKKVGEWCIDKFTKQVRLIWAIKDEHIYLAHPYGEPANSYANTEDKLIFIPHWENNIEEILEGLGYRTFFTVEGFDERGYEFIIMNHGSGSAKTRQLAVMLAVIALGKELKQ